MFQGLHVRTSRFILAKILLQVHIAAIMKGIINVLKKKYNE